MHVKVQPITIRGASRDSCRELFCKQNRQDFFSTRDILCVDIAHHTRTLYGGQDHGEKRCPPHIVGDTEHWCARRTNGNTVGLLWWSAQHPPVVPKQSKAVNGASEIGNITAKLPQTPLELIEKLKYCATTGRSPSEQAPWSHCYTHEKRIWVQQQRLLHPLLFGAHPHRHSPHIQKHRPCPAPPLPANSARDPSSKAALPPICFTVTNACWAAGQV